MLLGNVHFQPHQFAVLRWYEFVCVCSLIYWHFDFFIISLDRVIMYRTLVSALVHIQIFLSACFSGFYHFKKKTFFFFFFCRHKPTFFFLFKLIFFIAQPHCFPLANEEKRKVITNTVDLFCSMGAMMLIYLKSHHFKLSFWLWVSNSKHWFTTSFLQQGPETQLTSSFLLVLKQ